MKASSVRYVLTGSIFVITFILTYFLIVEEYRNINVSLITSVIFTILYWLMTIPRKTNPLPVPAPPKPILSKNELPPITDKPTKKERSRFFLEVGELYILIGNEKSNVTISKFIGYQVINSNSDDIEIFEDIITKQQSFALCAKKRYTDARFKAYSKLTFTEVIELTYFPESAYTWRSACTTDFNYIDPMLNYTNYTNAIEIKG